jgi:hypothetical protein
MVKHLSVDKGQDVNRVLSLIKIETGYEADRFIALDPPLSLMGNKEVLTLKLSSNLRENILKIDGPSFIIRELYEKLRVW